MLYSDITSDIFANAVALNLAVEAMTEMPVRSKFLTYGSLMACMAQIDLMSKCEYGMGEPQPGGQTRRMRSFVERYLDSQRVDEHRVAVKLMRHTLMHTGALRFLYDAATQTAYTWRVHFADTFPATEYTHYTLTPEDPQYETTLLSAVSGQVAAVMALNLNITAFAADLHRVAGAYLAAVDADPTLQTKCEEAYPAIEVQTLN
jgi:hypothetical protein